MVAPGEGAVWEAVDEDYGALLFFGLGWEVEVGWKTWSATVVYWKTVEDSTPLTAIDLRDDFVLPCLGRGDFVGHLGLYVGDVVSHVESVD